MFLRNLPSKHMATEIVLLALVYGGLMLSGALLTYAWMLDHMIQKLEHEANEIEHNIKCVNEMPCLFYPQRLPRYNTEDVPTREVYIL